MAPPRDSSTYRLNDTTHRYRSSTSDQRFCTWGVEKCRFSILSMAWTNQSSRWGETLFFSVRKGVAESSSPSSENTAMETMESRLLP